MNKKEKTFSHLLSILVILVIDIVVFVGAVLLDQKIATGTAVGHPAPAFTVIAYIVMPAITVIVAVVAVFKTIRGLIRNSRNK